MSYLDIAYAELPPMLARVLYLHDRLQGFAVWIWVTLVQEAQPHTCQGQL